MRRILRIMALVAGSVIGLVAGGVLGLLGAGFAVSRIANGNHDAGLAYSIVLGPLFFLIGATLGTAAGATVMQEVLRQRTSSWRALVGTVAGLLAGGVPTALCLRTLYEHEIWRGGLSAFLVAIAVACVSAAAGAVIGSGWKAKPTDG